jgi:hypothetical protein
MIYTGLKYQGETPLDYQYILNLKKMKGRRKQIFSRDGCQWEGGVHKERGNEGEYGCIFYPYMKIEE